MESTISLLACREVRTSAQSPEVLYGLWNSISEQSHDDPTCRKHKNRYMFVDVLWNRALDRVRTSRDSVQLDIEKYFVCYCIICRKSSRYNKKKCKQFPHDDSRQSGVVTSSSGSDDERLRSTLRRQLRNDLKEHAASPVD